MSYNPNQPRVPKGSEEGGEWTVAGNAARKAAGLSQVNMLGLPVTANLSEGQEVKIIGRVEGSGKTGVIFQIAPSGKYFGVKDKKGKFIGYYHESDLKGR